MNQYTKGEWKSRHPINNDYTIYTGEYGKGIVQVALLFESSPNAEANAHLIAAAPALYEALKSVLDDANNGSFTTLAGTVRKLVEQALAIAEVRNE